MVVGARTLSDQVCILYRRGFVALPTSRREKERLDILDCGETHEFASEFVPRLDSSSGRRIIGRSIGGACKVCNWLRQPPIFIPWITNQRSCAMLTGHGDHV